MPEVIFAYRNNPCVIERLYVFLHHIIYSEAVCYLVINYELGMCDIWNSTYT